MYNSKHYIALQYNTLQSRAVVNSSAASSRAASALLPLTGRRFKMTVRWVTLSAASDAFSGAPAATRATASSSLTWRLLL